MQTINCSTLDANNKHCQSLPSLSPKIQYSKARPKSVDISEIDKIELENFIMKDNDRHIVMKN